MDLVRRYHRSYPLDFREAALAKLPLCVSMACSDRIRIACPVVLFAAQLLATTFAASRHQDQDRRGRGGTGWTVGGLFSASTRIPRSPGARKAGASGRLVQNDHRGLSLL